MASGRTPGPEGQGSRPVQVEDGTGGRMVSPLPGPLGLTPDAISGAGGRARHGPRATAEVSRLAKLRIAQLAVESFRSQIVPEFRTPAGQLLSGQDYVLFFFGESFKVGSSGNGKPSPTDEQRAKTGVARLRAVLETRLEEFANEGETPAQFANRWGELLREFDRPAVDVAGLVIRQLEENYRRATNVVALELRTPSTELGSMMW